MPLEFLSEENFKNYLSKITDKVIQLISNYEPKKDHEKNKIDQIINNIHKRIFKLNLHELNFLLKAPDKLWVPYILFRYDFNRLANEHIYTKFPLYLLIEPTSICNLRCVMCFQSDKSFGSEKSFMGRMNMDLFKNIVDQAVEGGTKAVTLASRGDPSLNKSIEEMLDYMNGKFLELKLNTNGILLTEKMSRSILKNQVTDLVFSIDSYEKENYEQIRRKAKFEKVVSNIKSFMNIRKNEFPNHRTTVRVSGVKVDERQDRKKYNDFWAELVDYTGLVDMQTRWDTYNNETLPSDQLLPCGDLFERMYIWWDGTVNPCDVDYKSTLALGNVKFQSIKDIWNGDAYTKLRKKHLYGKRSDYKVCGQCDAWTK